MRYVAKKNVYAVCLRVGGLRELFIIVTCFVNSERAMPSVGSQRGAGT